MPKLPSPKGRDKAKTREAVESSHDLLAEAYPELTQALIDKALGLRFQDEKGNVYTKEPDTVALIRAIEILGGKPVARVETGAIGETTEFEEWIKGQVQAPTSTTIELPSGPLLSLPNSHPIVVVAEEAKASRLDVMSDVAKGLGWE